MSWKETCLMEERLKFMAAWLSEEESRSSLCERYGVSRKTGYKWAARYKREGLGGLSIARAPTDLPHKIEAKVAARIVSLRKRRSWGRASCERRCNEKSLGMRGRRRAR
ncbi:MAG: helix-turn-helix domain-containing protein [Reyranellaceae bacterium]